MSKTYDQKSRGKVLSKAREYYKNNRELLKEPVKNRYNSLTEDKKQKLKKYQKEYQKKCKNKYRSLSEDKNNIKRQYQKNRYHNRSDEEKQRLKDYQKEYQKSIKINIDHYQKIKKI